MPPKRIRIRPETVANKKRKHEKWERCFADYQIFQKKHGHGNVPTSSSNITGPLTDLGRWVKKQRQARRGIAGYARPTEETISRLDSIEFQWTACQFEMEWEEKLEELREYKRKHGDCNLTRSDDNRVLARWVSSQRSMFLDGTLKPHRMAKLDALGFDYSPGLYDKHDSRWYKHFEELCAFKKQFGHCHPTPTTIRQTNSSDDHLMMWVYHQCAKYHAGTIRTNRKEALNSINFFDAIPDEVGNGTAEPVRTSTEKESQPIKAEWKSKYRELKEFYRKYGHCKVVPSKHDVALSIWVSLQRRRLIFNQMSKAEVDLLDEIDFAWTKDLPNKEWHANLERLKEYQQRHAGDLNVPLDYQHRGGERLGRWVSIQRSKYREGVLLQDRITKLELLGFSWSANNIAEGEKSTLDEDTWETMFLKLTRFSHEHGHCSIPISVHGGSNSLSAWVVIQRKRYEKGMLSPTHKHLLDSIGFVWDIVQDEPEQTNWEAKIQKLIHFKNKEGRSEKPDEPTAGDLDSSNWTSRQRWVLMVDDAPEIDKIGLWALADRDLADGDDVDDEYVMTSFIKRAAEEEDAKGHAFEEDWLGERINKSTDSDDDLWTGSADAATNGSEATDRGRKVLPTSQISDIIENDGRIAVFYSEQEEYYEGVITQKRKSGQIYIEYDDGETEWTRIGKRVQLFAAAVVDDGSSDEVKASFDSDASYSDGSRVIGRTRRQRAVSKDRSRRRRRFKERHRTEVMSRKSTMQRCGDESDSAASEATSRQRSTRSASVAVSKENSSRQRRLKKRQRTSAMSRKSTTGRCGDESDSAASEKT